MPQATKTPSALPSVAGFKVGKEEESPPPVASHSVGPTTFAIPGEGGEAFVKRMMAGGGPARNGESEPQAFVTLLPSAYIYVLPQQLMHTQPITTHGLLCQYLKFLSRHFQSVRLSLPTCMTTPRSYLPVNW